jgi:hypothetical protein
MIIELNWNAPPLKTVYRPMSPDDFYLLTTNKTDPPLSYNFQLGKQGGKSFFCSIQAYFFQKTLPEKSFLRIERKKLPSMKQI